MFPAELPTHSKTTSDNFPGQFWSCSSEVKDGQYKPFGDRRECKQTRIDKCRKVLFLLIPSQNCFEYLASGRPKNYSGKISKNNLHWSQEWHRSTLSVKVSMFSLPAISPILLKNIMPFRSTASERDFNDWHFSKSSDSISSLLIKQPFSVLFLQ